MTIQWHMLKYTCKKDDDCEWQYNDICSNTQIIKMVILNDNTMTHAYALYTVLPIVIELDEATWHISIAIISPLTSKGRMSMLQPWIFVSSKTEGMAGNPRLPDAAVKYL